MPLTPKNRKEEWLEGLVQHETTLTPKNRPEAWIKEIIDASGGGGGGGASLLIATVDVNTSTLDKTWQEIYDADYCIVVTAVDGKSFAPVSEIYEDDGLYCLSAFSFNAQILIQFEASSANDYPVANMG